MEGYVGTKIDHPFIVNFDYVIQSETRIYFIMPFVVGGDLFTHLGLRNFSEEDTKFYII